MLTNVDDNNVYHNLMLPTLCSVCLSENASNIVPDRQSTDLPYYYDVMCPLCFDSFIILFPLFKKIKNRELTGSLYDTNV